MNGPQHYFQAERDIERAEEQNAREDSMWYLSRAQVHATLALAAAMAEPRHGQGIGRSDERDAAWKEVL